MYYNNNLNLYDLPASVKYGKNFAFLGLTAFEGLSLAFTAIGVGLQAATSGTQQPRHTEHELQIKRMSDAMREVRQHRLTEQQRNTQDVVVNLFNTASNAVGQGSQNYTRDMLTKAMDRPPRGPSVREEAPTDTPVTPADTADTAVSSSPSSTPYSKGMRPTGFETVDGNIRGIYPEKDEEESGGN